MTWKESYSPAKFMKITKIGRLEHLQKIDPCRQNAAGLIQMAYQVNPLISNDNDSYYI